VNGDVAIGADGLLIEPRRAGWPEAEVELGHLRMTGVAEGAHVLKRQQVAVRAAVRRMTGRTALDAGSRVLEDERAGEVGVARGAGFVVEAAERHAVARVVRVVTGRAGHRAFRQPVALVEGELAEDRLVAPEAGARALGDVLKTRRQVQDFFFTWMVWQLEQASPAAECALV